MKITPIAKGSAQPSASIVNQDSEGSHTPGQTRVIKMKTNMTPTSQVEIPVDVPIVKEASQNQSVTTESPGEGQERVTRSLSPEQVALLKQRRALQVRERELAEKEKALGQTKEGLSIEQIKADPLGVLKNAGVSYDDLTQRILQNPINAEVEALKAEIQALKSTTEKSFTERDSQNEAAALRQIRRDINVLVESDPNFEGIKWAQAQPEVVELIHRTFKKTGEVLDIEEAARLINDQIKEEYIDTFKKTKMFEALVPSQQTIQPGSQIRTLTSRDGTSVPLTRRERAILAAQGRLRAG